LAVVLCAGPGGCAALTNPAGFGIPVRQVPPELLAAPKGCEHTIPLTLLRQPPPDTYRLAPGDVLGVQVEGFLGERNQPVPLHVGPPVRTREQYLQPPAAGYPVPVQPDGNIILPKVGAIPVSGLSLAEAREAVRRRVVALVTPEEGKQLVLFVTLLYRRHSQVLVFRQEMPQLVTGTEIPPANGRRGTGHVVDLPAYEDDVLHALALTGGLPALEAYNEVVIFRDCFHNAQDRSLLLSQLPPGAALPDAVRALCPATQVLRIPLRLPCGQPLPVRPEDITLRTGDVVFLESRADGVFATAGLLPPGLHVLPRDRDLDVLDAIALVRGPLFNGAFGGSNLSGTLIQPGIGNPSPSLLSVLRRRPDGRQVLIAVDLRKAVRDPQERILVQAGDLLILQEKPSEALTRYLTQTFFNFNLFWEAFRGSHTVGLVDVATPDRLSTHTSTFGFAP
jgi:protein involved in polysaccharide export with SLBB domain